MNEIEKNPNPIKVLMVTPEAAPFAKAGGLADMVSGLARSLKELGVDVRILLPRYYAIKKDSLISVDDSFDSLGIPMGDNEEWVLPLKTTLPGTDVPVYLLDHEELYGRDGLYGYSAEEGFSDNLKRYSLLCRGAFQLCRRLKWIPDIIHAHDWPAALAPYFLDREEKHREFSKTASVLTLHNMQHQGKFPIRDMVTFQREMDMWSYERLEFDHAMNFLKAGIVTAQKISTVSPGYAEEIMTPGFGWGLQDILRNRHADIEGILNGVDYTVWNPETDSYIAPHNYSANDLSGKRRLKKILQQRVGLKPDSKIPLVGMVSRLTSQKGFDALASPVYGSLYSICRDMKVQFMILGTGNRWCEHELSLLSSQLPNLRVHIGFSEELAHLIEAGSDFFLMPSEFEPCGLNQIYSLRYGTLPIVRETGGLKDTVEGYTGKPGSGHGFTFHDLRPDVLYNVLSWVTETWYDRRDHIRKMRRKSMELNFSLAKTAKKYNSLYRDAIKAAEVRR